MTKIRSIENRPGLPDIENEFHVSAYPLTGWLCSICYEPAQVKQNGEIFCKKHAMEWRFGMGKTIEVMLAELK